MEAKEPLMPPISPKIPELSSESPLSRLFLRKGDAGKTLIDEKQFAAGEKLRSDFERAHMAQRITASYSESSGSGGRHWQMSDNAIERLSDNAIAARERLHRAFAAGGGRSFQESSIRSAAWPQVLNRPSASSICPRAVARRFWRWRSRGWHVIMV